VILFATVCPGLEPHHKLRATCVGITSLDLIILYLQAVLNLTYHMLLRFTPN